LAIQFFLKLEELHYRPNAIEQAKTILNRLKTHIKKLRKEHIWISSNDTNRLENMTTNYEEWFQAKIEEQESKSLLDFPVLLSHEIGYRLQPVVEYAQKLLSRQKPPDFDKKRKNATKSSNNTKENASNDSNTTQDSNYQSEIEIEMETETTNDNEIDNENDNENIHDDNDDYSNGYQNANDDKQDDDFEKDEI